MKKKVILDTNFLLIPGQFKVDIFAQIHRIMDFQYELCIVDKTNIELNKLAVVGKEKDRFASKLALVMVRQKSLKTLHSFAFIGSPTNKIIFLFRKVIKMQHPYPLFGIGSSYNTVCGFFFQSNRLSITLFILCD